jgi:EpsI family protein
LDDDWLPEYRGAIVRKQAYRHSGARVYVYMGYYPAQHQGEELINDLNRITNPEVWHVIYPRGRAGETLGVRYLEQMLQHASGHRRLVWYWYNVAGRQTTSGYAAKLLQVLGLVAGQRQACVIALGVDTGGDSAHAREVLGQFVAVMGPALEKLAAQQPTAAQ